MTSLVPERRVDVVEEGRSAGRSRIRCGIDEHLQFDTEGIETYCLAGWNATVYDAFVVGAAVQFCDHTTRRPSAGWRRDIALRVPVHDPHHWRSTAVSEALHDALSFLTGDRWRIDFVRRRKHFVPERQQRFDLPRSCVVMPFSDGLDSYLMAGLLQREHGDALVRVRLGAKASRGKRARTSPPRAFASMPWRVSCGRSGSVETSARSRGFRFALLSGIAAFLCKSRRIVLPESGQGALGPSLIPVGQAHADVRNHPLFMTRMERLVRALFGHEVHYEFPQLWPTKGQTLAAFIESRPDDADWLGTRSCWQGARQVSVSGSLRQCGNLRCMPTPTHERARSRGTRGIRQSTCGNAWAPLVSRTAPPRHLRIEGPRGRFTSTRLLASCISTIWPTCIGHRQARPSSRGRPSS